MSTPADFDRRLPDPGRFAPRGIPLVIRMAVYTISFLGLMLVGLPWAFYQIDVFFPALHVELGWLRYLGAAMFALFLSLYLASSFILTGRGKGAFVEFDPPTELVISGPYRYVRNPVAACLLATVLGEAIALSSTGVLLFFAICLFMAHQQVIRVEEPLLLQRYGQAYRDYCAEVPRWIPRYFPAKSTSPASR
jgi:protein-S-isoprenylcysteine O-methyltransferase Ste14